jgi:hypothetical protein
MQCLPGLQGAKRKRRFGAASDRHLQVTTGDAPPGLADRHRRRRAGGRIRQIRATQIVLDADPGGGRVVHAHQHGERLDAIRVVAVECLVAVVAGLRAAHPGADKDAGPAAIKLTQGIARTGQRLPGGDEGELADPVEHAPLRWLEMLVCVKACAGHKGCGESRGERHAEAVDCRTAGLGIGKHRGRAVAEGRDDTHAGDRNPRHRTHDGLHPGSTRLCIATVLHCGKRRRCGEPRRRRSSVAPSPVIAGS